MEEIKIGSIITITKSPDNWNREMDKYDGKQFKLVNSRDSNRAFADMPKEMQAWSWVLRNNHYRLATPEERERYYTDRGIMPLVGQKVILKPDQIWTDDMRMKYSNKIATVKYVLDTVFKTHETGDWNFKGWEPYEGVDVKPELITEKEVDIKIGSQYILCGHNGRIAGSSSGCFWSNKDCGSNGIVFHEKGLDKEEFTKSVLGYYNSGDCPVCNNIQDLLKLLKALEDADTKLSQEDDVTEIEPEKITSWNGYSIDDSFTVGGQECILCMDDVGSYPYYLSDVDSDDFFNALGVNKYDFQRRILGYSDPNEYDSPQCKSLEDLVKFWKAVEGQFKREVPGLEYIGKKVSIGKFIGEIAYHSFDAWEWSSSDWTSSTIFKGWTVDKYDFQQSVLGYRDVDENDFPYCKSYDNLMTFCRAIAREIAKKEDEAILSRAKTTSIPTSAGVSHGTPFTLKGVQGKLQVSSDGSNLWYWNDPSGDNSAVFKKLGVDKREMQLVALGYRAPGGVFPYCNTVEDLLKFLQYIESYPGPVKPYIQPQAVDPVAKSAYNPEISGVKAIIVNVPKI